MLGGSGTSASPYVHTKVTSPTRANLETCYEMTITPGLDIGFMAVERSVVIKFDKHMASRVLSSVVPSRHRQGVAVELHN